jgi:pimeloyl-ACP methyl ester carboxylesterase
MHMKKRLFIAVLAIATLALSLSAVALGEGMDLVGTWVGVLELPGAELGMVFHIAEENGSWSATLDVPAQGAAGIPVSEVSIADGTVVMNVALIAGVYSGQLSPDGTLVEGVWEQSGMQIPLNLEKTLEEMLGPNRPQEPQPPYPYTEVEVRYPNHKAGIELAGTLTIPEGEGPFPVVILISGSGPQDRNEELMGHKPFLVLADYLTRRGIAVLRYDDRGVGESTGIFATATTLDFTDDVLAGVEYLKTRPEIDPKRIGLIGHSEGGLVSPMAAKSSSDVAFIVLMAGPGVNGEQISNAQVELMLQVSGVSEEEIEERMKAQTELLALARNVQDVEKTVEEMKSLLWSLYEGLSEEELAALGDVETSIMMEISQLLSPWYQFFMTYDPLPALREVTCPVLAINGSKDLQVPSELNLRKIWKALSEGGNENYKIIELPGLNHLFQTSETGLPAEYYHIEETIAPLALKVMGDWLVQVTGVK